MTCAVRLLEAGLRVDVVARDLPRETTSAVAAAIWYPHRALPQDRVDHVASAPVQAALPDPAGDRGGFGLEQPVQVAPGNVVRGGDGRG